MADARCRDISAQPNYGTTHGRWLVVPYAGPNVETKRTFKLGPHTMSYYNPNTIYSPSLQPVKGYLSLSLTQPKLWKQLPVGLCLEALGHYSTYFRVHCNPDEVSALDHTPRLRWLNPQGSSHRHSMRLKGQPCCARWPGGHGRWSRCSSPAHALFIRT